MTRVLLAAGLTAVVVVRAATDAVAAPWLLVRAPNFTLVGGAPERTLREVGLRLERFREAFSRLYPRSNVRAPVRTVVLVFASDRSFESFTATDPVQLVSASGTFVPGTDVNYVALRLDAGDSVYRTLAHEYAHAMLRSAMPWVPLSCTT